MFPTTFRRVVASLAFAVGIVGVVFMNRATIHPPASSAHPGFTLEDVTAIAGVTFVHRKPVLDEKLDNIAPHIAALGASVSVADANGDGRPDLYFTTSRFGEANALYLNNGDGTFRDVAREAGIADLNTVDRGVSMGAVWGDFDNDGLEDLLVYRYGKLSLFRNLDGARFGDVTTDAGLDRWVNSNGAIWFDYDRDGWLDLYVTAYFRSDVNLYHLTSTKIMHDSFEFASNGGRNLLFHNRGNGTFEDVTDRTGVGSTRWTLAAASADFNDDGWPDLYLANDYGPEELFLNDHGGRFALVRVGLEADSKSGMSVSIGDVHNRGRMDVFVTDISEKGYLFQGNNLRLNLLAEIGRFENIAKGVVADAGWAWGAQFGDLNNDGRNDLYITNGFISASKDRSYWYGMSKVAGANKSLFEDARNWPAIGDASLSGYEHKRVLLNRGDEGWDDVAVRVGVTDTFDGRAVAFADLWNTGALDVIVANQDARPVVYRNTVEPGHHWVGLSLVGMRGHRSAIGAEVTVEFGDETQRRVVDGGMGFASQNDRRLHFGLGRRMQVDRLTIRWPSGRVQTLGRLEADRLHVITEPDGGR
ncbi:MAG: CRTAC1 family protein [Gemmatimonadota bacterium]